VKRRPTTTQDVAVAGRTGATLRRVRGLRQRGQADKLPAPNNCAWLGGFRPAVSLAFRPPADAGSEEGTTGLPEGFKKRVGGRGLVCWHMNRSVSSWPTTAGTPSGVNPWAARGRRGRRVGREARRWRGCAGVGVPGRCQS
jgi:hypothetical protein